MTGFEFNDALALAWFMACWIGYTLYARSGNRHARTISAEMNRYRRQWLLEMSRREIRLMDVNGLISLAQNVTFFASTTILAIGGLFAVHADHHDLGKGDRPPHALGKFGHQFGR